MLQTLNTPRKSQIKPPCINQKQPWRVDCALSQLFVTALHSINAYNMKIDVASRRHLTSLLSIIRIEFHSIALHSLTPIKRTMDAHHSCSHSSIFNSNFP